MSEHMPMLEHENAAVTMGALAARGEVDIASFGSGTQILNRTFLIKKMEIEFFISPPADGDVSAIPIPAVGNLVLMKTSGGTNADTVAECYDSAVEDQKVHENVIWTRNFIWVPTILDITGNDLVAYSSIYALFKTSKSFPKGYPLDKDETYVWKVFNQDPANAWVTGSFAYLRVRYFGVDL